MELFNILKEQGYSNKPAGGLAAVVKKGNGKFCFRFANVSGSRAPAVVEIASRD
jgi:hypothetical protein